jgi:tRNA dimethylallyltransferase
VAADRIHPNDPQRIQRALEIHQLTGRSMTDVIAENPPPPKDFDVIPVLVAPKDRARLAERISQRFEAMLKKGLIEEVQALKDRGDLHLDLPSMRAVGYRQVWEHLEGNASFEEMRTRGITATRQFAKRQMTWLRKESFPLELESEDPRLLEKARQAVGSLLA